MGWRPVDRLRLGIGERVDKTFARVAFKERRTDRATARDPDLIERLERLSAFYDDADAAGRLFPAPPEIAPRTDQVKEGRAVEVLDLSWPTPYTPLHAEYAEALARCPETRQARARWFRRPPPSPAILCLHGWGGGQYAIEERAFPTRWLNQIGFDVVLPVTPFHALRRGRQAGMPAFPSPDPVRSNEGFAQAILELRSLIRMLRRRGAPHVGVMGMSLGGFTSALLATVEPELDFCVPMIPFASLPVMMWSKGEQRPARRAAVESGLTLEVYSRPFKATTPLERALKIDPARVLIAAGERDVITPSQYAQDLHRHFAGSAMVTFPGSHLIQIGRREVFVALARMTAGLGILPPR